MGFVARLEDRLAIADVIHRWCRAIDRMDLGLIRTCFHPDAMAFHAPFPRDPEALIAWIEERQPAVIQSMHQAANMLIEFASDDTALVETYMTSRQRFSESATELRAAMLGSELAGHPGHLDVVSAGRYVDVFERRQGEWAILKRTVVVEGYWPRLNPDHPKPGPSWPALARRDFGDPVYVERRAVGLI